MSVCCNNPVRWRFAVKNCAEPAKLPTILGIVVHLKKSIVIPPPILLTDAFCSASSTCCSGSVKITYLNKLAQMLERCGTDQSFCLYYIHIGTRYWRVIRCQALMFFEVAFRRFLVICSLIELAFQHPTFRLHASAHPCTLSVLWPSSHCYRKIRWNVFKVITDESLSVVAIGWLSALQIVAIYG